MLKHLLPVTVVCLVSSVEPCFGQFNVYAPLSHRAANRVLEQGTWGPTATPSQTLEQTSFDAWFNAEVAAPVSGFSDLAFYNSQGNSNTDLTPMQAQFFSNSLTSPDQLRQRVAFALSKIWVVSELEINNASAFPPLYRIFAADAFANYRQLMRDVTLNPAMGKYLNMVNNEKANPAKGTAPNENYGREIMQLFTLGLTKLNTDGSLVLDSSGATEPTYTQPDVDGVSAAFTGWTYPPMPGYTTTGNNRAYYQLPMVPVQAYHDTGVKHFLGATLPAGRTADQDLDGALDVIFGQSSLPPFVSRQLIEQLVTSNPSADYIRRIADVFMNNGAGVRGDLKSVVYAILTDPEARAGDQGLEADSNFGHMREPVLFVANLLRGLNGSVTANNRAASYASNLGQYLFYAPSVFSYFSPGYRTSNGIVGPEFQIYSTQTASLRTGVVNSAVYGGQLDGATKFNIVAFTAAAANNTNLIHLIDSVFFHDTMSTNLQQAITQALAPLTAAADKSKAALYVALTSGEYQVIH